MCAICFALHYICHYRCILSRVLAIHFVLKEVCKMAFEIKPNRRESENKTIRFPIEVIDKVNEAITGKDVSFSNFVIQAVEYALENMEK